MSDSLVDILGYEAAEALALEAAASGKVINQVVLDRGPMTGEQFRQATAPETVTCLGSVKTRYGQE